jgi:hypothetical protein
VPDGSDSMLLLSTFLSGTKDGMGEEPFLSALVVSGFISIVRECQLILYNFNQGLRSVHLGSHYSLFSSGHQNAMVTIICGKYLLLF